MRNMSQRTGIVAIFITALLAMDVGAQQPATAPPAPGGAMDQYYGVPIYITQAKQAAAAATAEAKKHNISGTLVFAIVNGAGDIVYVQRSPSAKIAAVDIALAKARASVFYGIPTANFYEALKKNNLKDSLALPMNASMGPGGLPIIINGFIIGAVGVTGGYDEAIAEAAIRALAPAAAASASAQQPPTAEEQQTTSEPVLYGVSVNLNQVPRMLAAAEAEAKRRNISSFPMVVVDIDGEIVYAQSMAGARRSHLQITLDKARTAARYAVTSKSLEAKLLAGDLAQSMALPGAASEGWVGVPIIARGHLIGGVAVAGVRNPNDDAIASAAAAALADDDPLVVH
jgi:glc operon protein GlcG